MNPGGLTHPDMLLSLAEFMPSAVTIKTAAWATLAGHADLDCRVSPVMSSAPEWQAIDTMDITRAHRTIVLAYHPDIEPGMRAVTASTTYTIQSVRHDGSGVMTELLCEEVTVG